MNKTKLLISAALLTTFALLTVACSGIQQGIQVGKDTIALQQIGIAYRSYCTTNNKGPASVDELMKSATTQQEKDAVQQIKDGRFKAEWNVNVNDPTAGGNSAILVYSSSVTNNVRVVLMADCNTITALEEKDFQAKPKAKPGGGGAKEKEQDKK